MANFAFQKKQSIEKSEFYEVISEIENVQSCDFAENVLLIY